MNQHQDYDKIIKETIEKLGTPILHKLLGIDTTSIEDLPTTVPRTIERRADFLKSGIDSTDGQRKLYHLEFQSEVHPDMLERMLVYYSLFWEKHKLPIEQYVVYLGSGKWSANKKLEQKRLHFGYEVISINEIDYEQFLHSEYPEEIILAILANFRRQDKAKVIERILLALKSKAQKPKLLQKYITQMEILSKLRNLQPEIIKTISAMPITYDITTDLRFMEGVEKGVEKGMEKKTNEMVRALLVQGDLSIEIIASIANITVEQVKAIAADLKKKD